MKRNSRLSLALHTLGHMADDPDGIQTSAHIAKHAGTNPVVVRRVLGKLRDAGLLVAEKGHAGGWRLAKQPDQISLADVYLALDESFIAANGEEARPSCSVENALFGKVSDVLMEVETSLIQRLSQTSIADVRGN